MYDRSRNSVALDPLACLASTPDMGHITLILVGHSGRRDDLLVTKFANATPWKGVQKCSPKQLTTTSS